MTQAALPVTAFAIGALLSALGTGLIRRWSLRRGYVDRPGGHKQHATPVALGGGIALTLATTAPILLAILLANLWANGCPEWVPNEISRHLGGIRTRTPVALGVVATTMAICLMGWIDDLRPLSAGPKLLIQLLAAGAVVVLLDLRLMAHLPWGVSAGLSILWLLTLTNSFNFLDNMDGLAAGVGMIAAAVFATTALGAGQLFVPGWCWLLAGALAGFLPFNFHPARIYMGDAGSQVIGFLLGVLTILTTFGAPGKGQEPFGLLAPLVVMAVPLYDTMSVMFLRWRSGSAIWSGDLRHFSHRLVKRGMGVRQAVLVIWLATLVTALPALLLPTATWALAWGIVLQTLLVVTLVALLENSVRD